MNQMTFHTLQKHYLIHYFFIIFVVIDSVETNRQSNSVFYDGEGERTESWASSSGQGPNTSSIFSSLRGGAGSLMKNIKDASAKVMETVSAYVFIVYFSNCIKCIENFLIHLEAKLWQI